MSSQSFDLDLKNLPSPFIWHIKRKKCVPWFSFDKSKLNVSLIVSKGHKTYKLLLFISALAALCMCVGLNPLRSKPYIYIKCIRLWVLAFLLKMIFINRVIWATGHARSCLLYHRCTEVYLHDSNCLFPVGLLDVYQARICIGKHLQEQHHKQLLSE